MYSPSRSPLPPHSVRAQTVRNLPAMQKTWARSLVGKIAFRREWQPTPVFCLENPMDRGSWGAIIQGLAKSRTWPGTNPPCLMLHPVLGDWSPWGWFQAPVLSCPAELSYPGSCAPVTCPVTAQLFSLPSPVFLSLAPGEVHGHAHCCFLPAKINRV